MNFLVDNPLSPNVGAGLPAAGHNAGHVIDYHLHASTYEAIFERAAVESRVIVSADTDFGALLSLRQATSPSVILFQGSASKRSDEQVASILSALSAVDEALRRGAIVVMERHRLRLRELPITRRDPDA